MKMKAILAVVLLSSVGLSGSIAPSAEAGTAVSKGAPMPLQLRSEIARARVSAPESFRLVQGVRDRMSEVDRKKRGRLAVVAPAFRAMGEAALLPMLDHLMQPDADADLTESARAALRVGMLEAVGALRNPIAIPVYEAILTGPETHDAVIRAASEAMGKLGDDQTASRLLELSGQAGPKQLAILAGLATCRRPVVAQSLARWTGDADPALADTAVRTLGMLGARWAWETERMSQTGEGDSVRETASDALIAAFVRAGTPERRALAETAILLVDAPTASVQIARVRSDASGDTATALDRLAGRLARNPIRAPRDRAE